MAKERKRFQNPVDNRWPNACEATSSAASSTQVEARGTSQGGGSSSADADLFVKEVQEETQPVIKQLEQDLADAKDSQSKEDAKAAIKEAKDRLEEMILRVERRWDTTAGVRILEEALGHRDLYEVRDAGDEAHIVVNTETSFYQLVYSKVKQDDHLRGCST